MAEGGLKVGDWFFIVGLAHEESRPGCGIVLRDGTALVVRKTAHGRPRIGKEPILKDDDRTIRTNRRQFAVDDPALLVLETAELLIFPESCRW